MILLIKENKKYLLNYKVLDNCNGFLELAWESYDFFCFFFFFKKKLLKIFNVWAEVDTKARWS